MLVYEENFLNMSYNRVFITLWSWNVLLLCASLLVDDYVRDVTMDVCH